MMMMTYLEAARRKDLQRGEVRRARLVLQPEVGEAERLGRGLGEEVDALDLLHEPAIGRKGAAGARR